MGYRNNTNWRDFCLHYRLALGFVLKFRNTNINFFHCGFDEIGRSVLYLSDHLPCTIDRKNKGVAPCSDEYETEAYVGPIASDVSGDAKGKAKVERIETRRDGEMVSIIWPGIFKTIDLSSVIILYFPWFNLSSY